MNTERVLVIIKPDGMQKAIAGEIISIFLNCDLKLIGMKLVQVPIKLAKAHYGHLEKQFFFNEIIDYLMGNLHGNSPVIALVFSGNHAVSKCRALAGATNPEEANIKSVRGKFGRVTTKGLFENVVHVSSDTAEANREIALWFKKNELLEK